jgi:hypothetical protein
MEAGRGPEDVGWHAAIGQLLHQRPRIEEGDGAVGPQMGGHVPKVELGPAERSEGSHRVPPRQFHTRFRGT